MSDIRSTEVTQADFNHAVKERSHELPVMVDFWAPWCGPCRTLTPILHRLAEEYADKFHLVTVNTDDNPALSEEYGIRSIPAVKIFRHGVVVEEFTGVYPQAAIRALLDKHIERASDRLIIEAKKQVEAGEIAEGLQRLRQALQDDPGNSRIHPELAALLVREHEFDEAEKVLRALPAARQQDDDIQVLMIRMKYQRIAATLPPGGQLETASQAQAGDMTCRYHLAVHQLVKQQYAEALAVLLQIVQVDRRFQDDAARKTMLDIFALLGNTDPLTQKYRGLLSKALN